MDKVGTDERAGLPSASNWRRYELCSASFQLEQEAKRLGQDAYRGGFDAERGSAKHAWLAGEVVELSETEKATAQFLLERALGEVHRIFGEVSVTQEREQRYWLSLGAERVASGKFDRLYIGGSLALIQDFKTGWREPEPAETNAQLKFLAVVVALAHPHITEVVAQIISGPYGITETRFDLRQLASAWNDIHSTLSALHDPRASFSPSLEACRYCPALNVCPAVKALVPVVKTQVSSLPDGKRAGELLEECELIERYIEAIRAYYSQRLVEEPDYSVPGWSMQPGAQRRIVKDWLAAKARLVEFLDTGELETLVNYSIPAVEKLLGKTMKLKALQAKAKLAEILGETLELSEPTLSLKRMKEAVHILETP